MSYEYSEDGLVEAATQEVQEDLGWMVLTTLQKESLATQADRFAGFLGCFKKSEVILERNLLQALRTLNPDLPETAYQQAANPLKESAVVLSNGTESRVGTLTSPYKFFMEWKR